ncbi:MAG: peptidoglycan DD-metalloendopeptidase family protein [Clostridia bacterium]|nr:peptidoglycan DD-metalloendopeptidase family protein [Clostridia bacterium]
MYETHDLMRKTRSVRLAVMAACTLVFVFLLLIPQMIRPVDAAAAYSDATVKKYEEQLKVLNNQKKDVYAQLVKSQNSKSSALDTKYLLDQQINLTLAEIETYDSLIAETDKKIGEKTLEIIDKKADIDTQEKNFLSRLRITYEEGNVGYLELLFGAENLYDLLTRVERVGSMLDYDIRMMEQYQGDCDALKQIEDELEQTQLLQQEALVRQEERRQELELQQTNNEAYLKKLEASIYQDQKAYSSLAAKEAEVNAEMEKYIKEQQAKLNAQYVGGEFIWPLDVNKWKRISSHFGWRDLYGTKDYHRGIDIPAYQNENVYASNGGTVITATSHWSYGNYVVIDHGGGKSTLYAHNTSLCVKVGDKVKQGQIIAKVGTTGNSYGNHVHFEVRIDGVCQNPLDYVKQPK